MHTKVSISFNIGITNKSKNIITTAFYLLESKYLCNFAPKIKIQV